MRRLQKWPVLLSPRLDLQVTAPRLGSHDRDRACLGPAGELLLDPQAPGDGRAVARRLKQGPDQAHGPLSPEVAEIELMVPAGLQVNVGGLRLLPRVSVAD